MLFVVVIYSTHIDQAQEAIVIFKYDQGYWVMWIDDNGGMCTINVPHTESLSHKPNHRT